MSERMSGAAYREYWEGSESERAATRIVECSPRACLGRTGRCEEKYPTRGAKAAAGDGGGTSPRWRRASCGRFRLVLLRSGGSLPPPWTPASLSLFAGQKT